MAAISSSSDSDSSTRSAINKRGRTVPTTAMMGNECGSRKVGMSICEIVKALASPDVREKLAGLGAEPIGNSTGEFAAMQKSEAARCAKLAKEANLRAD